MIRRNLLLGVCFGHQLIAKALGGVVKKAEVGWVLGLQEYTFHNHFPWLENPNKDIKLSTRIKIKLLIFLRERL